MPVTITIHGENAGHILAELRGLSEGFVVPAVSDVSSDNERVVGTSPALVAPYIGDPQTAETPKPRGRKPKAETTKLPEGPALNVVANISTGGERDDPEQVNELSAEDKASLKIDNDALTALGEAETLTLDDVRNSAKAYIDKWGKVAASQDLVPIVQAAGGVPNIGKLDPNDQPLLRKVAAAFLDAAKADARFVKAAA